jgi:hypothetical protein
MVLGDTCPNCHRLLMEIDHYGERLIGCIEFNRWGWPGSDNFFMALPEEELIERLRVTRTALLFSRY